MYVMNMRQIYLTAVCPGIFVVADPPNGAISRRARAIRFYALSSYRNPRLVSILIMYVSWVNGQRSLLTSQLHLSLLKRPFVQPFAGPWQTKVSDWIRREDRRGAPGGSATTTNANPLKRLKRPLMTIQSLLPLNYISPPAITADIQPADQDRRPIDRSCFCSVDFSRYSDN